MNILLPSFSICKYVSNPASAIIYYPSGFFEVGLIALSK